MATRWGPPRKKVIAINDNMPLAPQHTTAPQNTTAASRLCAEDTDSTLRDQEERFLETTRAVEAMLAATQITTTQPQPQGRLPHAPSSSSSSSSSSTRSGSGAVNVYALRAKHSSTHANTTNKDVHQTAEFSSHGTASTTDGADRRARSSHHLAASVVDGAAGAGGGGGAPDTTSGLSATQQLLHRFAAEDAAAANAAEAAAMEASWHALRSTPYTAPSRTSRPSTRKTEKRKMTPSLWKLVLPFVSAAGLVAMERVSKVLRAQSGSEAHWKNLCRSVGLNAPTEVSWRETLLSVMKEEAMGSAVGLPIGPGLDRVGAAYYASAAEGRASPAPLAVAEAGYLSTSLDSLTQKLPSRLTLPVATTQTQWWQGNGFAGVPDVASFCPELCERKAELAGLKAALRAVTTRREASARLTQFEAAVARTYCKSYCFASFFELELLLSTASAAPEARHWHNFKRDFCVKSYYCMKCCVNGDPKGKGDLTRRQAERVLECMSWFVGAGAVKGVREIVTARLLC